MGEDLLSTTVQRIKEECKPLLDALGDGQGVIVDISGVTTIDSKGLNLLIGLYQETIKKNCGFRVAGSSPELKQLFAFVKMTERFGIEAS